MTTTTLAISAPRRAKPDKNCQVGRYRRSGEIIPVLQVDAISIQYPNILLRTHSPIFQFSRFSLTQAKTEAILLHS